MPVKCSHLLLLFCHKSTNTFWLGKRIIEKNNPRMIRELHKGCFVQGRVEPVDAMDWQDLGITPVLPDAVRFRFNISATERIGWWLRHLPGEIKCYPAPYLPMTNDLRSTGPHSIWVLFSKCSRALQLSDEGDGTSYPGNRQHPFTFPSGPTIYRETHYYYGIQETVQRPPRWGKTENQCLHEGQGEILRP